MNWIQLRTLLWLRWRLSWNQLSRGRVLNKVVAVLVVIAGYTTAAGAAIGGFFLGWKVLGANAPNVTLLAFDVLTGVFLFTWVIGVLNELQRSETIDVQRLMHLPISLPQLFGINYLASHVTLSLMVALPALLTLSLGLAVSAGWQMLLLIPLGLSFVTAVTSWTYYLRGWLLSLMVNQRRKRAIIMGLTLAVIVIAQLPNFWFNVYGHGRNRRASREPFAAPGTYGASAESRVIHQTIPPLWMAQGAFGLRQGKLLPALGGFAGLSFLTWMGLALAYRSALRFYTAESKSKSTPTASPAGPTTVPNVDAVPSGAPLPTASLLVERGLPGVPHDTAGLALATLRGMLRAPEVKMIMVGPLIMMIVFGSLFSAGDRRSMPDAFRMFIPTASICLLFFTLMQVKLNQFGFDRNGFRALVLLPTPRKQFLLAKDLAFAPFLLLPALFVLIGLPFLIPRIPLAGLLAGVAQALTLYLLVSIVGNIWSIGAPFRISAGSMKPTKNQPRIIFLTLLAQVVYPLITIPILIPPGCEFLAQQAGWHAEWPINLILSVTALGCVGLLYAGSLEALGGWFQRREKQMLATLTEEVE